MLKEVLWSEERSYRTGSENEPVKFYLDALCNSKNFDLLLGYFSSAAINVLSLGFASFLYNGGKMRVVVNNILSQDDRDAIKAGIHGDVNAESFDLSDITQLKLTLDEYGKHFFECLAWLISKERIELVIIRPKGKEGISHFKNGVFYDDNDYVGFSASCNFTAFGLLENLERLEIFLGWENKRSTIFTTGIKRDFDEIFLGKSDKVEYLGIDQIQVAIKNEFGNKTIEELLITEKELTKKKSIFLSNHKTQKSLSKLIDQIEGIQNQPRFPYSEGPREYQITAYLKWNENGNQGIFAMATGTGKTITSLNCLLELYRQTNSYKAVITVPTTALLEQWKEECLKFNFKNIITVSSKEKWNEKLSFFNTASRLTEISFVIIVTYASFSRAKFQSNFKLLPKDTLLIADEVHNLGAASLLKLLPGIHLRKRIGLSATPTRKYDIEGNTSIDRFFNDASPFVYSYSMKDALSVGWLCKYKYFPHVVYLTEQELNDYIKISKQLLKYFDSKTGRYKECQEVDILLLKRKRIIHKAVNKKIIFKQIIQDEFRSKGNLKYSLIYVPEGLEPDYSKIDEYEEDEDEYRLINEYTKIVKDIDESIMVKQYTSQSQDRNEIIKEFEKGVVHVLTSMKCLDEGVDVPRSELAVFCSSTGNPRQFIQRRGRVLRLHKDKIFAVIHDLVVVPRIFSDQGNYEMERNLLKKELERVVDFSELSVNKIDTYEALYEVMDSYNLNLNDLISK